MAQLTREQDRLKCQPDKALLVIDVQKNSALLGNPIDETGDLAVMAAVHELSPVLGAGAAGRAMGLPRGAPAQHRTWMRRTAFVGPCSAAVLGPRRPWRSMPRRVRRCSRPSTANASSAPPRRLCMPRCSTRVATSARCARCTGCWRPMAAVASGATSSPIRPAPTPELLAIAPNQIWSWDFHVTQ